MFLDYYHLREQPFGVTPDPRYLYLSRAHREALASLYYGVNAGRGFMALIAEPGMGKTTLLTQLLERLRKSACVAFLFQTQCNSRELVRYLLADMGLESREQDPVVLHEQLKQALIRMSRAGRQFVLVIDEAQNLDDSVLEAVRLLSDFETPSSKLIQIILSGQPQLAEKLTSPPLVQLRQRVAILSRLEPFNREETDRYVGHRLRIAGHAGGRLFTSEAMALIAARSQGIPRNINNLCFNALSLGCALRRWKVDREIVLEAVGDLEVRPTGSAGHSAQVGVSQPPAAKSHNLPRRGHQINIDHGLIWSAALGAAFFLMFLLLFPSVRKVCKKPFSRAFAVTLPGARTILSYHPLTPVSDAAPVRTSKGTQLERVPGAADFAPNPAIPTEVNPGKTIYRVCFGYLGRFDSWLSQQVFEFFRKSGAKSVVRLESESNFPVKTKRRQETSLSAPAKVSGQPQKGIRNE